MTPAHFLELRTPLWKHLEELLGKTRRKGISALTEEELHQAVRLYPLIVVDVSRARLYKLDASVQDYLNNLAIAAHGLLYRRNTIRPLAHVWHFFQKDYPILFRRLGGYVIFALLLFLTGMMSTYVTVRLRPSTAYVFVPYGLEVPNTGEGVTAEDISERFRNIPNAPLAAGVITNNISVAFYAFALGISAGIGTCMILFSNAMMLGGFFAHFSNHNLAYPLFCFLAPHGVLEIFAIIVCGAAGLRLGLSLAIPGEFTRLHSLRRGSREAVLLLLGTIPMFILAGIMEGFITPSHLPGGIKIILGIAVWIVVIAYLLGTGRSLDTPKSAIIGGDS